MTRTRLVLTAALLTAACAQDAAPGDQEPTFDELRDEPGFSESADGVPRAPAGFVDFYLGTVVLDTLSRQGSFTPDDSVGYSMIRMPEWAVNDAMQSGAPVTLSLCDESHGIVLFHQDTGSIYEAPSEGTINCTPWVQKYDGRSTIEYRSGQDGVRGFAQTGVLPNGNLYAGAVMHGNLPDACGEGSSGNSSMMLGTFFEDPSLDDPMLGRCGGGPPPATED